MSLINQMLKDLEANRRQTDRDASILTRLRSSSGSGRRSRFHPAWLLLLAVLVVVALLLFMPGHKKTVVATATKLPAPADTKTAAPKKQTALKTQQQSNQVAAQAAKSLQTTQPEQLAKTEHAVKAQAMSKPLGLPAQHVLHYIKQAVALTPAQQVAAMYQKAQQALDNSDDDVAIAQLRMILQRQPTDLHARALLASVLLSDNDASQADSVINAGLQRMPHYAPFTNIKARILMQQGQYARAIGVLNQATPELDQNPDYYALLAALYQQSQKYMLAAQLYHQLVHFDPANGIWWMGLGIALESAEKNNAALEAFQHALKGVGLSPSTKAYVQQQVDKLS